MSEEPINKDKEQKEKERKKRVRRIVTATLSVFLALMILFSIVFRSCTSEPTAHGLSWDDDAVSGGLEKADEEEIRKKLNVTVEAGMINISINTSPVFENGGSAGNIMMVNEKVNIYPQKVVITRNDTQEVIYESGAVPVGSKIENAVLDVHLPKGTYNCTAMFHNLDPNTGESLGCAGAVINITIKN